MILNYTIMVDVMVYNTATIYIFANLLIIIFSFGIVCFISMDQIHD